MLQQLRGKLGQGCKTQAIHSSSASGQELYNDPLYYYKHKGTLKINSNICVPPQTN